MEFFVEWAFGALIIVLGPLLTLLDLPGNTVMLAAGIGYAFFDEARYFDGRLLSALVLVYAFGEIWEFIVSFFWYTPTQGIVGCGIFDCCWHFYWLLLSAQAFSRCWVLFWVVPLVHIWWPLATNICGPAAKTMLFELAWKAAKTQFVAMLGKIVASFAMALLLLKQIFLNN